MRALRFGGLAVDAGDARGAARALSAAERVGLEPGGQYRALFDHAARLVKAADDRSHADAERQRAKEEAAKRKHDDKVPRGRDGRFYCERCMEEHFGERCTSCGNAVLKFDRNPWTNESLCEACADRAPCGCCRRARTR